MGGKRITYYMFLIFRLGLAQYAILELGMSPQFGVPGFGNLVMPAVMRVRRLTPLCHYAIL